MRQKLHTIQEMIFLLIKKKNQTSGFVCLCCRWTSFVLKEELDFTEVSLTGSHLDGCF